MAPVIIHLKKQPWARTIVVGTGQHRELAKQALEIFGVEIDVNLDVMVQNQRLSSLSARILSRFDDLMAADAPDLVLAQGDTTTVMAVSLCCFHANVPLAHVEAGLRTHNLANPFPEELNRRVATLAARLHFAPTRGARDNLLRESVDPETIFVTGNPVIDALLMAAPKIPSGGDEDMILVTMHRRENFNEPMERVCSAIAKLHEMNRHIRFVIPVHPNPNVKGMIYGKLGGLERVRLIEPAPYDVLASLIQGSKLVLTDSGGIQEEAPALRKPVLILRTETERPEAIEAGVAKLVGTDENQIVEQVVRLLSNPEYYRSMASGASPYGDGKAAERITFQCANFLGVSSVAPPHPLDFVAERGFGQGQREL